MPWPKEDEIRWVEQRVRERELIESERDVPQYEKHHPEWGKSGKWEKMDYLAWLLHAQDRLPFQKIGDRLYARDAPGEGRKMKAWRAWARVEWEFDRGPLKRERKPLGFAILGGCVVLIPPKPGQPRPTAIPEPEPQPGPQQSPAMQPAKAGISST